MTGPFPHQHGDPRGLQERIDGQLQERIEEAVEMAGLELLVALRKKQRRPAPELARLTAEELERLINQKVLLQFAFDTGIKAEDTAVDLAAQSIAAQNQLTLAQLYQQVAADGLSAGQFRAQLRDQILLQRLRERDLEPRVRVTDLDIDAYLQAQQNTQDLSKLDINLAQVLIAVPESATGEQVQALQEKARKVLERARAGDDFATLVRDFSDPTAQANGGQLGLRSADRSLEISPTWSVARRRSKRW